MKQNANVRTLVAVTPMNNHFIESTHEEKDLGVIVDDSLQFHRHAVAAIKKVNSVLGVL